METNKDVKNGVNNLLNKNCISIKSSWEFINKNTTDMTDFLIIDSIKYPLFYWRSDPQIEAVARNAIKNIGGSVSLKISGLIRKNYRIDAFLYKALDSAEWILDSEIKKITAYFNTNAVNVTLLMKNDKVALLELSSSLPDGIEEQTRYTAWGKEGMESSRVVSTKTRPQSVYMFKDDKTYEFNDSTLELYGLSYEDSIKAVEIFKVLKEERNIKNNLERDKKLRFYIEKAHESSDKNKCIEL